MCPESPDYVNQNLMRIDYGGLLGDGKTHEFAPYSLILYRGGLYLAGKSNLGDKVITLAVERIRKASKLDTRFDYPTGYSPADYTEGTFGLLDGPETAVEILIMNPETVAYLESRRIHPSQTFHKRRDGKTVLAMKVRGTEELKSWIAGFGPYLKVIKPAALREEVRELHAAAAALYR
jgi:proteasome accessory factor B